jgi:hypothetical protein
MTTQKQARIDQCKEELRKMLKPGDTVYTTLRHVSRSGMYRVINLYIIQDNEPRWISSWAADLLEGFDNRHEGCKASGCGMDMGFNLVYNLSYTLFPDGYDDAEGHHNDGGYALKQRWMN